MSRSSHGNHLKEFGSIRVPDAAYRFQDHRLFSPKEEDFVSFLTIYGHGGRFGHVTMTRLKEVSSPPPRPIEPPHKIWIQLAQWLLRRRCLKMLTDGRRTTDAYLYYKLTNEPSAQVS